MIPIGWEAGCPSTNLDAVVKITIFSVRREFKMDSPNLQFIILVTFFTELSLFTSYTWIYSKS